METVLPPPVPSQIAPRSAEQNFDFSGKGSELFVVYLKGLLLTLVTLGIYSFWAKVDVRRYLFQKTHFFNRSFNYHATGKEKFIAFLKGLLLIAIVGAMIYGLGYAVYILSSSVEMGMMTGYLLAFSIFLALKPAILVGKARYELSRTSWSNVRFRFNGNVRTCFSIFLKGVLLSIITLGLYVPWFLRNLHAFYVNHTQLGNQGFSYNGEGKELFLIYVKGVLLSMITLGIFSAWMHAELRRYHARHCSFQGHRFSSHLTGGDVLVTYLLSMLLIVCTFGIGIPWAINMWLSMEINCLQYLGVPDLEAIQGDMDTGASAFSDGLAEAGDALSTLADMLGG